VPTLVPGSSKLSDGCNDPALHPEIIKNTRELLDAAAAAGAPNLIMLSGNRRGKTDEQGIENTVKLLNAVKKYAEDKGVTLCMELLNSKVNHPDYQCDRTAWGVEVCKRVGSPRVKLLYDIYHMQIMEGDIIRTIEQNMQWFGHFHTAGNPGRHELSVDQEINYKAVCKKIADLGYTGYICHEYTPVVKSAREALLEAIEACTV
jgi:hydroxypyruvate isomerase